MNRQKRAEVISDAMRQRSGEVDSDDKLVAFLYILVRDSVTPGELEELLIAAGNDEDRAHTFSNGWLARYAQDVAERLR